MWPHVLVNNLFTLVNQSLSHAEELFASHIVVTVINVTWLILYAR